MTEEQANDLRQLRIAAEQREWTTLQDTLKRLLTTLDPLVALTVAARQVQKFLPRFEKEYPDALWLRQLLLTVVSYASAPNELPGHAVNQFSRPGCGNFVMAVFELAQAVQMQHTVFERYSFITNATANALLADLQYFYFNRHPEQYETLRDPDTDDATRAEIQQAFWLDKGVAWRDAATWLEIAADVEDRIQNA